MMLPTFDLTLNFIPLSKVSTLITRILRELFFRRMKLKELNLPKKEKISEETCKTSMTA
jgi:hypothetical protein